MSRTEIQSDSLEATAAIARGFARRLRPGDIVRLIGELGAGKTTFVRALADALGVQPGLVSSPTFVLCNEYPTPGDGPDLVHLDCYRMGGPDELDSIGWDRLVGSDAIILIEWPDRIEPELPEDTVTITIEHTGEHARFFTIDMPVPNEPRP